VLINENNHKYLPFLDLDTTFVSGNLTSNSKLNLSLNLCWQIMFYNPKRGFWEPLLEKNQIQMDYNSGVNNNPRKFLFLEQKKGILDFNISDDFLNTLQQTL
jgi:hypothetical protein